MTIITFKRARVIALTKLGIQALICRVVGGGHVVWCAGARVPRMAVGIRDSHCTVRPGD